MGSRVVRRQAGGKHPVEEVEGEFPVVKEHDEAATPSQSMSRKRMRGGFAGKLMLAAGIGAAGAAIANADTLYFNGVAEPVAGVRATVDGKSNIVRVEVHDEPPLLLDGRLVRVEHDDHPTAADSGRKPKAVVREVLLKYREAGGEVDFTVAGLSESEPTVRPVHIEAKQPLERPVVKEPSHVKPDDGKEQAPAGGEQKDDKTKYLPLAAAAAAGLYLLYQASKRFGIFVQRTSIMYHDYRVRRSIGYNDWTGVLKSCDRLIEDGAEGKAKTWLTAAADHFTQTGDYDGMKQLIPRLQKVGNSETATQMTVLLQNRPKEKKPRK